MMSVPYFVDIHTAVLDLKYGDAISPICIYFVQIMQRMHNGHVCLCQNRRLSAEFLGIERVKQK
jgi:hypothetical protein